jgi:ABC-type Na+ efflux pump permease subunit
MSREGGGSERPDGPRRDADSGDGGKRPRLTIAKRELASLRSEKTIVLALAIQLFVAAFSSFLVVGLVSMYDPSGPQGVDLEVAVAGNASGDLAGSLSDRDDLSVRRYDSQANARVAFESGGADVLLIATQRADSTVRVRAVVPEGSVRTTVIVVQLQEALTEYERAERFDRIQYLDHRPVETPGRTASSPYFGFTYTILVPMLMFLPVFISGSVAVDSMTEEIQRGTLELLRVSPVTMWDIVDAKLLATASLAPIQALAWLLLLGGNGITVANVSGIVAVVAGLALGVTTLGLSLSLLAPDRRQAQFLYASAVLVAVALTTLLPEHPANTIARLAIDSPGGTTWIAVGGYLLAGVASYLTMRTLVRRVDVEGL